MKINVQTEIGMVSQNVDLEVPDFLFEGADDSLKRKIVNSFIQSYVEGHVEVVKILLTEDDCAIRWASKNGHEEIVNLLKDWENIRKKNSDEKIEELDIIDDEILLTQKLQFSTIDCDKEIEALRKIIQNGGLN